MKKVFLIILNWNGGEMTVNCLRSLEGIETREMDVKVVVVDNGSTDNSVERIKERYKDIKILRNRENLGFAEGNNVGIRYALKIGADFVCLLNNDTRVPSDFLLHLIEVANSDKKVGIVGGKIYFEKGYEFHKDRYAKG